MIGRSDEKLWDKYAEEYAKEIHADGYGRDAMAAVRLAEKFMGE